MLADIDEADVRRTQAWVRENGGTAEIVVVDVSLEEDVEKMVNETLRVYGRIDLLINNAGIAIGGEVTELPSRDWEWIIHTNDLSQVYSMAPAAVSEAPDDDAPSPVPSPAATDAAASPAATASAAATAVATTISGGLKLKNETAYDLSVPELLQAGPSIRLERGKPQILIIHTHSSEAYAPAGLDRYENADSNRTEDKRYSVIRVGDELTDILEQSGLTVLHDREIYDYPSYSGSYARSGAAVEQYLKDNPSIRVVIDLHRDALAAGDVVYKTMILRIVLKGREVL